MKHVHTKRLGGLPIQQVTITATLEWDQGHPDTHFVQGEPPGWSENTGVEIKAGPLTVSLSFIDVEPTNPALWIVDEAQVHYRISDGRRQYLAWGEKPKRRGRALRLAALPDVLEVVMLAYEDHKVAERLSVAQESLYLLESEANMIHSEAAMYGRPLHAQGAGRHPSA